MYITLSLFLFISPETLSDFLWFVFPRKSGLKWLNNPLMESKVFCHEL